MTTELDSVKYGKVDSISSKEIKISPAKTIVFRRYIDHLTTSSPEERITDFNPGRFHIYTFPVVPGISNARKWKWDKESDSDIFYLSQYAGTDIGCLKSVTMLTIDKDTLASSEASYEKFLNIPVSGWLFSKEQDFDSYIKEDYNYAAYYYNPVNVTLNRQDYNKVILEPAGFNFKYWGQNYDFTSGYDREDYMLYGIKETLFTDSLTEMTSQPCDYDVKKLTTRSSAIMIVYHKDNFKIPVTYCELHNSFNAAYGTIRIEWSNNGIITIK